MTIAYVHLDCEVETHQLARWTPTKPMENLQL